MQVQRLGTKRKEEKAEAETEKAPPLTPSVSNTHIGNVNPADTAGCKVIPGTTPGSNKEVTAKDNVQMHTPTVQTKESSMKTLQEHTSKQQHFYKEAKDNPKGKGPSASAAIVKVVNSEFGAVLNHKTVLR